MFKLNMIVSGIILIQLYLLRISAEFIYGNVFDYEQNLTAVYKDPAHVFGEDLLRTTVFYLDELMELEDALEDKDEEKKALNMLAELYNKGGPKHIEHVPYGKFIDTYNWTSSQVDDLGKYIQMTSETWNRLLSRIKVFIKDGKVKVKDLSGNLVVL